MFSFGKFYVLANLVNSQQEHYKKGTRRGCLKLVSGLKGPSKTPDPKGP